MPDFTTYDKNDPNSRKGIARDGETLRVPMTMMDGRSISDIGRLLLGSAYSQSMSEADVKREVVRKRLGDASVAGRSDEYLAACFDTLTAMSQAGQPSGGSNTGAIADHRQEAQVAYDSMVSYLSTAWEAGEGATQPRQVADQRQVNADETPYEKYKRTLTDAWRGE